MKLTRTKKVLGGIAIAGALAVTGIVGIAQQKAPQDQAGQENAGKRMERGRHGRGRGMNRGFHGGRFAEKLNLTDAQKEQVKQIETRFHDSNKALREQGRGGKGKGFGFFDGSTFDEAAVRAAAQERANKHVEMEVARARMMSEIYAILTPEQKAQIAAERQQKEQKREQWRSRRGSNGVQSQ